MDTQEKLDELYQTQTKESAQFRLNQLSYGSLANNPSEQYLLTLMRGLYDFQDQVKAALQKCYDNKEKNRLNNEECEQANGDEEEIKTAI